MMIRKGLFLSAVIVVMSIFLFSSCAEKEVKPEAKPEAVAPKEKMKDELLAKVEETPKLQDIHFDFDKYNIREDAKATLMKNADWLKKNPGVKIQVEGHCDERGANDYNLALGDKRAKSTRDYLSSLGIDGGRISTISFGEERPQDPGHNEAAWAKNRRAHFVILK